MSETRFKKPADGPLGAPRSLLGPVGSMARASWVPEGAEGLGSGGGFWGPLTYAKIDYDAHCTVGVVIAFAYVRRPLSFVGGGSR